MNFDRNKMEMNITNIDLQMYNYSVNIYPVNGAGLGMSYSYLLNERKNDVSLHWMIPLMLIAVLFVFFSLSCLIYYKNKIKRQFVYENEM